MDKKEIIKYLTELRSDYEKRIKVNEENNQNFIGMYNIAYFNAITDVLNYINNNVDNKNNKTENKITLKEFLNMYNVPENKVCGIMLNEVKSDELLFCYRNVIISKILNNNIVLNYKNYFVKSFGFDKDILVINIYE